MTMNFFKKGRDSHPPGLDLTPSTAASTLPPSPFFAPSSRTPTVLKPVSTPGGTTKLRRTKVSDRESKSTLSGAAFNLINTIVGAGIVGIPYAVREAGLVAGVGMVVLSAALTVKSLRLIIETAKHIDVPSYETLCESSFGRPGFLFISLAMFANAYGAMVSYLMIVKSTLPRLLGVGMGSGAGDVAMRRAVLTVSSMCVILPLSAQRDMASLSRTSIISVCFDCVMVVVVAVRSPFVETIKEAGGMGEVVRGSTIHPSTFFVGLGVLSFAFVCQHGAFIIAGSLRRPTRERWGKVTCLALSVCGVLATTCGVVGYLGYLEDTDGNILNNLGTGGPARVARGLMCCAMFFVYPMESFVARHVAVVLLFKGRKAHDGDDHAILARRDRRIALTVALYLLALAPALLFDDLGSILAVSGSVGGSSLSYLGPGACYLAIHGDEFLGMVRGGRWGGSRLGPAALEAAASGGEGGDAPPPPPPRGGLLGLVDSLFWYVLLMPLWVAVAVLGQRMLSKHEEEEALKSPHTNRLGKIVHRLPNHHRWVRTRPGPGARGGVAPPRRDTPDSEEDGAGGMGEMVPLVRHGSMPRTGSGGALASSGGAAGVLDPSRYGSRGVGGGGGGAPPALGNRGIAAAIAAAASKDEDDDDVGEEDDPQESPPTAWDFVLAIAFMIFGVVAMTAGLLSVFMSSGASVGGRRLVFEV